MNHDKHHSIRRIVLPSGRSIEVVRFPETKARPNAGLHACPDCRSELVQPVAWSEGDDEHWELTLECPNCRRATEGVYRQDQVHDLEERLDDGLAELLSDLKRLAHANMADEIERFTAALSADHILPEDF